jgi:hypothetical protein
MFTLGQADPTPTRVSDTIGGGYTMIPQKFYHSNAGRNALGLIGGNDVSLISGNMVDLESDLRNITRDLSRDPRRQYQPSCPLGAPPTDGKTVGPAPANALSSVSGGPCAPWPKRLVFTERSTGAVRTIATAPRHLPTMQYVSYPGVPAPAPFRQEVYGSPWRF